MGIKKTNAMRELDKNKIEYEALQYEVDENYLGAVSVSAKTGEDITKVFKTLALVNEKDELFIVCIPGSDEINLKELAKIIKTKKLDMLEMKKLQERTGYIRGGCSPIGIKKKHKTFIHKSCLDKDYIVISGGQRGVQIKLNPLDLIKVLNMQVENIII